MCQASQNVRPGVVDGVLLPAADARVLVLAARLSVATEGEEVIAGGRVLPGALVEVRPAPRIERNGFLQVRSAPVERQGLSHGLFLQRPQALFGACAAAVVEPAGADRQPDQLEPPAQRGALRFGDAAPAPS